MKDDTTKMKPDKPDNHITLMVITVDGNYTDDYNKHNKLQKVVETTIEKLNLLYDLAQYGLFKKEATTPFDLATTIEQAGLTDNDELVLRKLNGGGGERL